MSFETYLNNVDIIDKHGVQNVDVDTACIYKGDVSHINIQEPNIVPLPQPLAAVVLGLNNTGIPIPHDKYYSAWTDIDAQELYLNTKPTCYMILSKPGVGAYTLGEALSKKLNCIHLNPKLLVEDEIKQNGPTGSCLMFNMTHSNVCDFQTLLMLLKIKLQSPAVQHRGYVLSGFPLVTSTTSPHYLIKTLISEEAYNVVYDLLIDIILNLKKKKPKSSKQDDTSQKTSVSSRILEEEKTPEIEEEHEPEEASDEELPPVELPKFILNICSDVIFNTKPHFVTKKSMFLQQVREIFDFSLKPDIIIHITCPDADLVTLKEHKYIDYKNNQHIFEPFTSEVSSDIRWPSLYKIEDYQNPYDLHSFKPKYICKPPINFAQRATEQMCNFRKHVLPYLTNQIKDFDPKFVIKLDGRSTTQQMMYHTMNRLVLMHIHPVIIPEPLYMEDPPEDLEEFWTNIEEIRPVHTESSVTFKRIPSPWFNRCPVQLKNRCSVKGNPKYAVMFFKHVYLLSSLQAMISFCRNPRPYLKSQYLEPTCRIIVIGTHLSGKTMVSECLSWLFDVPIIYYNKLVENEKQLKHETFSKTILSEIIATIEDKRFTEWQRAELDRVTKLELWCDKQIKVLKRYVQLLSQHLSLRNKRSQEKELQGEEQIQEEAEEEDNVFEKEVAPFRNQLSFLPFLDNIEDCEIAITDNTLSKYAPIPLKTETEVPKIPMLGDQDVTEAISAYIVTNDLQKELEPSTEVLMNAIKNQIMEIDKKAQNDTNLEQLFGKYIIDGFPSDPVCWEHISKLMPDYTIALIENREIDKVIVKYYIDLETRVRNYQERFLLANDPFIKLKLITKKPSECTNLNMTMIVQDTVSGALNNEKTTEDNDDEHPEEKIDPALMELWTQEVEKFRENWDSVKLKVEEDFKSYIEVELENKSDINVIEQVLLNMRKCYYLTTQINEEGELEELDDDQEDNLKDPLSDNSPQFLGDTNIYCPIAFYNYNILWQGKPEFSATYNNKTHYFCKEEFIELFVNDVTAYQSYNKPFKKLPPLKICVIGCIGSGKTSISKYIAKELGLMYIDFTQLLNEYLMPRHFKKVGRQYENIFRDSPIDEDGVVDFQMNEENENMISDILSNEDEIRRMVHSYYERGSPILPTLMQKLIKKVWFDKPFSDTGFVLDGFPRLPSDVENMITSLCIPDLVLELISSSETSLKRLSSAMFQTWKMQLKEAKQLANDKLRKEINEWMQFITKHVVSKAICEEIFDCVFASDFQTLGPSAESVIMDSHPLGLVKVNPYIFKFYNEMIIEYPEPTSTIEWETSDDAHERIDSRIESVYESDDENIQNAKDVLLEQRIKLISIDAMKSIDKICRTVMLKLEYLRTRCASFFEQTFIVPYNIAETLLLEGFCFLSKFNRYCPVHIQENPHSTLNLYDMHKKKRNLYTVVHRSNVYFIFGIGSVAKFRKNPLRYITCDAIKSYNCYPLKIGVIGAPKSGKSSLSAQLAKRNGLICISKGKALRQILDNMSWTELGTRILKILCGGKCVGADLIMEAIQTIAIDARTSTNGFVLDGMPYSPPEAMQLVHDGLYPNIVFDISASKVSILDYSQKQIYNEILKLKPPYAYSLVEYRFSEWHKSSNKVRDWISNDFQNLYKLNGDDSKWQCLQDANDVIKTVTYKIHNYLKNVENNIVLADVMCISSDVFNQKVSPYKNMCPFCLRKNVLRHSGYPVDRKGIVQYRNRYYWICSDHIGFALNNPESLLTSEKVNIPEIPAVVKHVNLSFVYEKGICIVTYANNLPAQKIVRGDKKFAANFQGNTYLFCSERCLNIFLTKPTTYSDIVVFKGTGTFPPLCLKSLPNLGYLEQTLGNILTEACCSVNAIRPKYPGLSLKTSAFLYLALYLKTHNPCMDDGKIRLYSRALTIFEARCKIILKVGLCLRSMDNPFSNYPKCLHLSGARASFKLSEQLNVALKPSIATTKSLNAHKSSVSYDTGFKVILNEKEDN